MTLQEHDHTIGNKFEVRDSSIETLLVGMKKGLEA